VICDFKEEDQDDQEKVTDEHFSIQGNFTSIQGNISFTLLMLLLLPG